MSFGALLDTALAGSQRRDPPATLPAFASLAPEVHLGGAEPGCEPQREPEDRLLRSASYAGLRRLAGRPLDPVADVVAVEPCEPELRPAISPLAGAHLLEILANQPALLIEWLGLAERGKWRVSHDCLPDLLEHLTARREIDELVMQVGGERLFWLANLNPAWHFVARLDPEEQFALGTPTERAGALRRIRRQNPARGRELLEAIFNARSERAETRSAMLDALREGLSAEDEPVLQQAVQDARKELREKGLRLIRLIPDSRFGQRWIERARTLVVFRGQLVDVLEPGEPDPAWIDDGLDPRPPKGIGRTAWILKQTLALTPPAIWPHGTLAAVQRSDWSQPLLSGLTQAAVAYADADWCEELVLSRSVSPAALLGALAPDRAEGVVRRLFETDPNGVAGVVASLKHVWSEDFSAWVVARLPAFLADAAARAVALLHNASLGLEPTVLPAVERLLETDLDPAWARPALQRLVKTLQFRLAMRQELLSS